MILIISQNKKIARDISNTFYTFGILSQGVSPHESFSEVSNLYRLILIVGPENFPDINDYLKRLHSYNSDIPVFALTDREYSYQFNGIFDKVYTKPDITTRLATKMAEHLYTMRPIVFGEYHIGGFHASIYDFPVTYFDTPLNLTKTETMILRYLSVAYPIPQSASQIIKYAFRTGSETTEASVRTHISMMNKKFESTINKRMIEHHNNAGYIVLTPHYKQILYPENFV